MIRRTTATVLAAAGLALSPRHAAADTSWSTQMQFAQTPSGPALDLNRYFFTSTGTYTFVVRVGIFNFGGTPPGEANHGVYDWTTGAVATGLQSGESLGVSSATSRIAPFNFGPATSFGGAIAAGGTQITGVNCARDVSTGGPLPWYWDTNIGGPGPLPVPDVQDLGVNSYTNIFRFTVQVTTLAASDIVITFSGTGGPVTRWAIFGQSPPTGPDAPGSVSYLGVAPPLHAYDPAQLRLIRIPAPPTAIGLALAGLVALRRRRAPMPHPP